MEWDESETISWDYFSVYKITMLIEIQNKVVFIYHQDNAKIKFIRFYSAIKIEIKYSYSIKK